MTAQEKTETSNLLESLADRLEQAEEDAAEAAASLFRFATRTDDTYDDEEEMSSDEFEDAFNAQLHEYTALTIHAIALGAALMTQVSKATAPTTTFNAEV